MDPTIRELLRHSIASARAACRNVSDALRRSPAAGISPSVRDQRQGWSALLRHAADSGNVVEALGDDDFRFRTDLADALFGASETLAAELPQLPPLVVKLLSMVVILSAHVRIETQAQIGRTIHDRHAADLFRTIHEQMRSTGFEVNDSTRAAKRTAVQSIVDWLESSPEEYDRRLVASVKFVLRNLP